MAGGLLAGAVQGTAYGLVLWLLVGNSGPVWAAALVHLALGALAAPFFGATRRAFPPGPAPGLWAMMYWGSAYMVFSGIGGDWQYLAAALAAIVFTPISGRFLR